MLNPVTLFTIDPISNGYDRMLSADKLTVLAIWLTYAYHTPDAKPLWFANDGEFATRDGWTIKLKGMEGAMSLDTVGQFLKAISDQAELDGDLYGRIYPTFDEYHIGSELSSYCVKTLDGILGYYDNNENSYLPVALRYSDDLKVWYGLKGNRREDTEFLCTRFKFDNLSLAQI